MSNLELQALADAVKLSKDELLARFPEFTDQQAVSTASRFLAFALGGVDMAQTREAPFSSADSSLRNQILTWKAAELMTDRERAVFFGLPHGCRIREGAKILAPEKLDCGENIWIGEGAILDAQGGLSIGDNSQIGLGVMIWSHTSHKQAISGETAVSRDKIQYRKTTIGRNVFIAGPSVVLPGITVGDRAIVAPMTVVDRDIAPGEIFSASRSFKALEERVAALERGGLAPDRVNEADADR